MNASGRVSSLALPENVIHRAGVDDLPLRYVDVEHRCCGRTPAAQVGDLKGATSLPGQVRAPRVAAFVGEHAE